MRFFLLLFVSLLLYRHAHKHKYTDTYTRSYACTYIPGSYVYLCVFAPLSLRMPQDFFFYWKCVRVVSIDSLVCAYVRCSLWYIYNQIGWMAYTEQQSTLFNRIIAHKLVPNDDVVGWKCYYNEIHKGQKLIMLPFIWKCASAYVLRWNKSVEKNAHTHAWCYIWNDIM